MFVLGPLGSDSWEAMNLLEDVLTGAAKRGAGATLSLACIQEDAGRILCADLKGPFPTGFLVWDLASQLHDADLRGQCFVREWPHISRTGYVGSSGAGVWCKSLLGFCSA